MSLIVGLCLFQSTTDIGCPSASAQSVGQLFVDDIDNIANGDSGINPVGNGFNVDSGVTHLNIVSRQVTPDVLQGSIDASHPSADNTDYLATDERYDWCAGYALYYTEHK